MVMIMVVMLVLNPQMFIKMLLFWYPVSHIVFPGYSAGMRFKNDKEFSPITSICFVQTIIFKYIICEANILTAR